MPRACAASSASAIGRTTLERLSRRQLAPFAEDGAERAALNELENEVDGSGVAADEVVDADDGRMVEPTRDLAFADEAAKRTTGSDAYRSSRSLIATTSSRAPWRARRTMPIPPRPRIALDAVAAVERRADEPLDVVVEDRTVDRADPARRVVPGAAGWTSTWNGDAFVDAGIEGAMGGSLADAGVRAIIGGERHGRVGSDDVPLLAAASSAVSSTLSWCRSRCLSGTWAPRCGGGGLTVGWRNPREADYDT